MESNSIPFILSINFIRFLHDPFSKFTHLCSHPLFSTIVTIYILILLYVPSFFITIALSPVLNSTTIILLYLLKLGANETLQKESSSQESRILGSSGNGKLEKKPNYLASKVLDCKDNHFKGSPIDDHNHYLYSGLALDSNSMKSRFLDFIDQTQTHVEFDPKTGLGLECNQTHVEYKPTSDLDMECNQTHVDFKNDMGLESNSMESSQVIQKEETKEMDPKQVDTKMTFHEWNLRGPLEIIYEAYEGEEEDDEESNENNEDSNHKHVLSDKHPSLLMYYPESETDSSSNGDFPMNEKWETHESVFFKWEDEEEEREELIEISLDRYGKRSNQFFYVEEDNLIEIDIFPTRN